MGHLGKYMWVSIYFYFDSLIPAETGETAKTFLENSKILAIFHQRLTQAISFGSSTISLLQFAYNLDIHNQFFPKSISRGSLFILSWQSNNHRLFHIDLKHWERYCSAEMHSFYYWKDVMNLVWFMRKVSFKFHFWRNIHHIFKREKPSFREVFESILPIRSCWDRTDLREWISFVTIGKLLIRYIDFELISFHNSHTRVFEE